jgi:hypothetical protein
MGALVKITLNPIALSDDIFDTVYSTCWRDVTLCYAPYVGNINSIAKINKNNDAS